MTFGEAVYKRIRDIEIEDEMDAAYLTPTGPRKIISKTEHSITLATDTGGHKGYEIIKTDLLERITIVEISRERDAPTHKKPLTNEVKGEVADIAFKPHG